MSAVEVEVKSISEYSESAIRRIRPINDQVMVARDTGAKQLGAIIIPNVDSNSIDVHIGRVLAVGLKAKVSTSKGPVKPGDRILSVRVVNKRLDDIDMRTADKGEKVAFLPAEHCLGVLTDTEILPINDCLLLEGQPDRKQYQNITILGGDSLDIHTCKILSVGPLVTQASAGEYALAPSRFGVVLDSFELRKLFGGSLKLIKEKSVTGVASTGDIEGKAYPESLKEVDRRLV